MENIAGREQGEQIKNARDLMTSAIGSCCDGELEERLRNNLDTNN